MKTIIVHLNCHTHPIASALIDALPEKEYDIVKIINFKKQDIADDLLKKCDIYIYQHIEGEHWGNYNSENFLSKLSKGCLSINYPILRFNPFWPFNTKNAFRVNSNLIRKSEYFPNGDKYLLEKIDKYKNSDELVSKYLKEDVNLVTDLDRELKDILEWFESPRNSKDINVADFIREFFRDKLLFHTVDHISDYFLNFMIDNLFQLLGIKKKKNYSCKFMQQDNVPIHGSIIEHYNLSFVDKNSLYLYRGEYFNTKDYYTKYVKEMLQLL